MLASGLSRSLPLRLSRSFTTSSQCRNALAAVATEPSPPRRKGRVPRPNPQSQSLLPPEKLRALVSLYHQCDNFITLENLEERIDEAFVGKQVPGQSRFTDQVTRSSLRELLKRQREAPKIIPWMAAEEINLGVSKTVDHWSGEISNRERILIDALCGAETPRPGGRTLPGYDTLMEARKKTRKHESEEY